MLRTLIRTSVKLHSRGHFIRCVWSARRTKRYTLKIPCNIRSSMKSPLDSGSSQKSKRILKRIKPERSREIIAALHYVIISKVNIPGHAGHLCFRRNNIRVCFWRWFPPEKQKVALKNDPPRVDRVIAEHSKRTANWIITRCLFTNAKHKQI